MTFVEVPTEVWSSSVFPFLSQGLYQLRVRTCAFFSLLSNSPYWDLAMVWWSLALFFSLGYIIDEFDWFLPLPSPGDENHRARKLNNQTELGENPVSRAFSLWNAENTNQVAIWHWNQRVSPGLRRPCFLQFFSSIIARLQRNTILIFRSTSYSLGSFANSLGTRLNIVTHPPRSRDVASTSILGLSQTMQWNKWSTENCKITCRWSTISLLFLKNRSIFRRFLNAVHR